MLRAGLLHLDLYVTVLRVYVIEYFFAALSRVRQDFGIQVFIDMYRQILLR